MLATKLIEKLQALVARHGDRECFVQPANGTPAYPYDVVFADKAYDDHTGCYVVSDPDGEKIEELEPGEEVFVITSDGVNVL